MADVVDLIVNVVTGLIDIVVGIFTLDWSRIVAGLGEIIGGVVAFVLDLIPILIGGTLVGTFIDAADGWSLRSYVRGLLQDKYGDSDPEGLKRMFDALGLNGGGFGLRIEATATRSQIRSDRSSRPGTPPDLVDWHNSGAIDLKMLAGFNPPVWWSRFWPELVGDNGGISESDIDAYLAAGGIGDGIKHFSLFAMSQGDLNSRLDCADAHSRELGLIFRWTKVDGVLTRSDQVLVNRPAFATLLTSPPFNRTNTATNAQRAIDEVTMPLVIGGWGYTDGTGMGISAHLVDSTCLEADDSGSTSFPGEGITGTHFRYRKPDLAFKYTAIHEIGHTFGLCHVDGLLRIMYTNAAGASKSSWSWSSLAQYLTTGVEAGFILDEGKKVWDYIVANVDSARLQTRAF
ncbi:MAG TPA: hypothetical protein VNI35_04985 [Nitrospira sp.]|nr:hypothetical protein [Nitrospira sp.]